MKSDTRTLLKFGLPFLLFYIINNLISFISENFISDSKEVQSSVLINLLFFLGKCFLACLCTYIIFELAKRRGKDHFVIDTLASAVKWILSFLFFPIVNNVIGVPFGNMLLNIFEAGGGILISLLILLMEFGIACLCADFVFQIAEGKKNRPLKFPS